MKRPWPTQVCVFDQTLQQVLEPFGVHSKAEWGKQMSSTHACRHARPSLSSAPLARAARSRQRGTQADAPSSPEARGRRRGWAPALCRLRVWTSA